MQVKTLKPLKGDYGRARKGEIITVEDRDAKLLLRRGLVVEVKAKAPPRTKAAD